MNPYEIFPAFGVPVIMMLVAGFVIWKGIEARHRERLTMLDKGMSAEEIRSIYASRWAGRGRGTVALKIGILLLAVGAGLLLGETLHDLYGVSESYIPGFMMAFGGAGLIVFYIVASRGKGTGNGA